jgi:drug/metabolite transporter (DMT)-like permease
MPAPLLMVCASLLFSVMGVCVKLASDQYAAGELVFYRGVAGVLIMAGYARFSGVALRTPVPAMHFWRSVSGVVALSLWFYSIGGLPLATAMTLNYMSSVWMALFMLGGAVMAGTNRALDGRLVAAVVAGFGGVALVLRPTIDGQQLWHGLCGLLSGLLAAMAYLQVTALGRAGEPEVRIVFYFSLGGVVAGAATSAASGGFHAHDIRGVALLVAIGLLATAAQLMMTRAYAIGRTLSNATLQYLGIVYSFAFGIWLFDDRMSAMAMAGIVLIVAAGLSATFLSTRSAAGTAAHPTET